MLELAGNSPVTPARYRPVYCDSCPDGRRGEESGGGSLRQRIALGAAGTNSVVGAGW